ncbi:uncharacterized protein LOC111984692 [Quercus suber]|uniref:uncharacterized protein LOC111984692 n=1 Tax=Quercus suber TaxID=58331 RepID=UPI000CE18C8C|nr:uncharacterized protein LOC111984692 [Quercus suber]
MKAGKLNQFLHQPIGQFGHSGTEFHKDSAPRPALGTINVIFAKPGNSGGSGTRVMSVGGGCDLEENKEGTLQPHDDALVVTIRIGCYDVKRVLVDQGSRAEIMYSDLYKGLSLKPKDLERYDSPLIGFDGRIVVPRGMIRLPIQAGDEEV